MGCSNSVSVLAKSSKGTLLAMQKTNSSTVKAAGGQELVQKTTVTPLVAQEASPAGLEVLLEEIEAEPAREPEPADFSVADDYAADVEAAALKIQAVQRAMSARRQIKTMNADGKEPDAKTGGADVIAAVVELTSGKDAELSTSAYVRSGTVPDSSEKRGLILNIEGLGIYSHFSKKAASSTF